jgi:hypothetical protein
MKKTKRTAGKISIVVLVSAITIFLIISVYSTGGRSAAHSGGDPGQKNLTVQTGIIPEKDTTDASPASPTDSHDSIFNQRGEDFVLSVTENGNSLYKNLEITLTNGNPIKDVISIDGSTSRLENLLFSNNALFELKRLLPNEEREQIVVTAKTVLPGGYGTVGNYTIYRVDEEKLTQLINLITERDFPGLEGQPVQKLTASVSEKMEDGQLAIVYRFLADSLHHRTIVFRWNGSSFVDSSGKYKSIDAKYRP